MKASVARWEVPRSWHDTIHYVEQLLYDKLALAIGHELCPADVRDYMRFHHRRLLHVACLKGTKGRYYLDCC